MDFLKLYQHLLPRAKAWTLTTSKPLRDFFQALADEPANAKLFLDQVFQDLDPYTTRQLTAWETQFGLPAVGLTTTERRERLAARWASKGGQDPSYIQETLHAEGFTGVYIHEWWKTPMASPPDARNPTLYTPPTMPNSVILVNKIFTAWSPHRIACGEDLAECGEIWGTTFSRIEYDVTTDPDTWPFYLYFGGATFPDPAVVPAGRFEELENLLLKICPAHLWLVIIQ